MIHAVMEVQPDQFTISSDQLAQQSAHQQDRRAIGGSVLHFTTMLAKDLCHLIGIF
jgi:hypothetical protein